LTSDAWSLLGIFGTEDRCVATVSELATILKTKSFLQILDPHMPSGAHSERFNRVRSRLAEHGVVDDEINEVELLQDIDTMREQLGRFLAGSGPNIILDITSMPKWWFFPLVRFLLEDTRAQTVLVTYTSADKYGEQLSSDPLALRPLPTFDEHRDQEQYDEVLVSVGFAPLGLKELFERDIGNIRYLFPFPPGPPNFFRNWRFLHALETDVENLALKLDDRWHLHMYDVSNAFDAIVKATKSGERTCALAPFGPKTFSLSMCLFALAAAKAGKEPVHAYYSQPRRYSADYTTGIKLIGGKPDIKAYCVKLRGVEQYRL
jgi:hypothetical protein